MTIDFFELIDSGAGGVFRCHATLPDQALESAAQRKMLVVPVRLLAARDKNGFLETVARALQFPAYFGHNWDAFYDCLLDLKHGDGAGTLLVLRDASGFARADPEEFAAAVDTLVDAADYWKDKNKALLVVVELETPALAPELAQISRPTA
ncbi:MAG TPA: barstar family protein [Burkholderiales bacterium]|nr:barstar family protein [Burkholderiales bacterium]